MAEVKVAWNEAATRVWAATDPRIQATLDRLAALLVVAMKREAPVSPVHPVYATGGATVKGGTRYAGDFPLRPSGFLRSSIHAFRLPDGSVIVGPTAPYAWYVVDGTSAHPIDSKGPWPLRNRATGAVFGRHVNHPGTSPNNFVIRGLHAIEGLTVVIV